MLARDNLPKIDLKPPVFLHLPIIHGLDGDEKMSSSKGNLISIDDPPEVIAKKINSAYCPMAVVEGNPLLEIYRHHIFPKKARLTINRPEKFGGNLSYNNYINLENDFKSGDIHPADLKTALSTELTDILGPVRRYFKK
jgi:tyrosyl-tRNA synthetase